MQQRALRLAAENKQVFGKELLAKYDIPSAPALASSLKALKEKGILDEEGTVKGRVIFDISFPSLCHLVEDGFLDIF